MVQHTTEAPYPDPFCFGLLAEVSVGRSARPRSVVRFTGGRLGRFGSVGGAEHGVVVCLTHRLQRVFADQNATPREVELCGLPKLGGA